MAESLEKRVEKARKRAWDLDTTAREAKNLARAAAEERVSLEAELDEKQWVDAQIELGVDPDEIDVENRIVRTLPEGPTYDESAGG